jgi:hypothetical protein
MARLLVGASTASPGRAPDNPSLANRRPGQRERTAATQSDLESLIAEFFVGGCSGGPSGRGPASAM